MSAYVYIRSEPHLYTVGFYDPAGKWVSESDHDTRESAARRVALLNGGEAVGAVIDLLQALRERGQREPKADM